MVELDEIFRSEKPVGLERREIVSFKPVDLDEVQESVATLDNRRQRYLSYVLAGVSVLIMVAYSFYTMSIHRALAGSALFCSMISGMSIALEDEKMLSFSIFCFSAITFIGFAFGATLLSGFVNASSVVMLSYLGREK